MELLTVVAEGFAAVEAPAPVKASALAHLTRWLTDPDFAEYRPQLEWMVKTGQFSGLVDRFFQILPFGTGGRRGAVGIGPNRMNNWTLGASVQGHCEYLRQRFPGKTLQVGLAYDVRRFNDARHQYCPDLPNPTMGVSSRSFAELAAAVNAGAARPRHLLYDVRFAVQNHPFPDIVIPGIATRLQTLSSGTSRFDLACELTEDGKRFEIIWLFRSAAAARPDVADLDRLFRAVLEDSAT